MEAESGVLDTVVTAFTDERDYRDLTPTIPYILDYHILATTMDEHVLGPIRRGMQAAGIPIEFSKGDAWYESWAPASISYGRTEQRLFDEVVSDYERRRMFERG